LPRKNLMHLRILHRTTYAYAGKASESFNELRLRPIDDATRYLICTDGLSDVIDAAAIAAVLSENQGVAAVFELWRVAITGGGPDNITVALAEIVSMETPSDPAG